MDPFYKPRSDIGQRGGGNLDFATMNPKVQISRLPIRLHGLGHITGSPEPLGLGLYSVENTRSCFTEGGAEASMPHFPRVESLGRVSVHYARHRCYSRCRQDDPGSISSNEGQHQESHSTGGWQGGICPPSSPCARSLGLSSSCCHLTATVQLAKFECANSVPPQGLLVPPGGWFLWLFCWSCQS